MRTWMLLAVMAVGGWVQAGWQAEYQLQSLWQEPDTDGPLPLPLEAPAWQGQQRLSLVYQHQGLFAHARWTQQPLADPGVWQFPELFFDTDLSGSAPWALSVGAKHWQWDYQYAHGLLNWLGFAPLAPQLPVATPAVLAEYFAANAVWQLGCSVASSSLCLLRSEWFGQQWDAQALLGVQQDWRLGLAGQWLLGDALNLRASLLWQQSQPWHRLHRLDDDWLSVSPWSLERQSSGQLVLGGTYNAGNGLSWMVEHGVHPLALGADDWRRLLALADWQAQQPPHPALVGNQLWLAEASLLQPLSRHQSLLRLSYGWGDWLPSAALQVYWLDRPRFVLALAADWQLNELAVVSVGYRLHDARGPLAPLGQQLSLELTVSTF